MKKRTKLTICLGVICALLVAISSWYTIAFNNSRFIVPMDLSEYVFRVQDLPMIISGVLLTLYIVNIVVLFLESIKTNRRRELTLQSTRTINPKLGFLGLLGFAGFLGFWTYSVDKTIFPFVFFLFFGYCGLVTGNINHPVSPNVCGGIGNLTKGVNGLCCMALWN